MKANVYKSEGRTTPDDEEESENDQNSYLDNNQEEAE